jgi:hypothetical protein
MRKPVKRNVRRPLARVLAIEDRHVRCHVASMIWFDSSPNDGAFQTDSKLVYAVPPHERDGLHEMIHDSRICTHDAISADFCEAVAQALSRCGVGYTLAMARDRVRPDSWYTHKYRGEKNQRRIRYSCDPMDRHMVYRERWRASAGGAVDETIEIDVDTTQVDGYRVSMPSSIESAVGRGRE